MLKSQQLAQLFTALESTGQEARLVGGCVRDELLGYKLEDIDIATALRPDQVTQLLTEYEIKVIPTGIKFGTVTAVIDQKSFEITTLRKDISCDGRHPEVEFTNDFAEDAARRDFTINAMSRDKNGKLYDYFGGQQDLGLGIVRFVGDASARIQEDYLRILRFFRFFARYGQNDPDKAAIKACAEFAAGIDQLSGERIQAEMLKMLKSAHYVKVLKLMAYHHILPFIMPQVVLDGDYLDSYIAQEKLYGLKPNALRSLAAILFGSKQIDPLAKRWKLSNKAYHYVRNILYCPALTNSALVKKAIYDFGNELVMDILIVQGNQNSQLLEMAQIWQAPHFPLAGQDLLDIGVPPGKELGIMLSKALEKWQDADYQLDKEMLKAYLKTTF